MKDAWIQYCSTYVLLFVQSQIPKRWYLFSTYHTQYLFLVPCCTCRFNVTDFCMYDLDPTQRTTMFPSTSCRNPLCPFSHKVITNHAAYSRHLNCSTGCLHHIQTRWSATANQCHPSLSHVVTTSTKSPVLLRSQSVNGNKTFAAEPKQPSSATNGIYSSKVERARTDDDFQGYEADNTSKVWPEATPNHQAYVNTPHAS